MITGFRLDRGGAQAKYDVTPDLTTFGKVIGGGLPIGAVGGRRDVMETLSPLGPVFHAGTLSGNPLATAAGLAALDQLVPDVYIELAARARHLAALLREACAGGRVPGPVPGRRHAASASCAATCPPPVDFDGARRTDEAAYAAFFQAMLAEGVALAPGAYEAIFVGLAHDDAVLDDIGARAAEPPRGADRRRAIAIGVLRTPSVPALRRDPPVASRRCGRCSRGGSSPRIAALVRAGPGRLRAVRRRRLDRPGRRAEPAEPTRRADLVVARARARRREGFAMSARRAQPGRR